MYQPPDWLQYADGAHPRGFNGKNPYRDKLEILGPSVSTIFDVGAHHGQTTQRYLEVFPEAKIHAFEPTRESFSILSETYRAESRVVPVQMAAADVVGTRRFYTYRDLSVVNSLLPLTTTDNVDAEVIEEAPRFVKTTMLDDYAEALGLSSIDILKFDIQGGEINALKGATRLLAERRVRLIFAEVDFVPIYSGQTWGSGLIEFLRDRGYALFDFYNFAYSPTGQLRWGDAIFLPIKPSDHARHPQERR